MNINRFVIRMAGRPLVVVMHDDPLVAETIADSIYSSLNRMGMPLLAVPVQEDIELWDKEASRDQEVRGYRRND